MCVAYCTSPQPTNQMVYVKRFSSLQTPNSHGLPMASHLGGRVIQHQHFFVSLLVSGLDAAKTKEVQQSFTKCSQYEESNTTHQWHLSCGRFPRYFPAQNLANRIPCCAKENNVCLGPKILSITGSLPGPRNRVKEGRGGRRKKHLPVFHIRGRRKTEELCCSGGRAFRRNAETWPMKQLQSGTLVKLEPPRWPLPRQAQL